MGVARVCGCGMCVRVDVCEYCVCVWCMNEMCVCVCVTCIWEGVERIADKIMHPN